MIARLFQMFSKPKSALTDEAREFITKLATSKIWILAVGLRGNPAILSMTDPAALDIVAAHRIDVTKIGVDDSVFPFNYQRDGKHTLPFFTSKERAKQFATELGLAADVAVFQPYGIKAGFVGSPENDIFELVLDPGSPAERALTSDERLLLRRVSTTA